MTLEQQLVALVKEHGLNALSIGINLRDDGSYFFGSYAHASGACGSSTYMRDTVSECIGEAITNLKAKLGQSLIAVPELAAA